MSNVSKAEFTSNLLDLAIATVELLKRAGAQESHIEPLVASITPGVPSAGIPWAVHFCKGHGVVLGNTKAEAMANLQAMHYSARFILGLA
ncbi:hypothetical protein FDI69_gp139 [Rhodococcus phage Trina]|uniref:Uncharacterized protein n=1 Tax=Rhodococcus phage Trina TaxID=2027905 RepID=A0A2D1A4I3_9CAUD|nr:hypothetical protein FDI69_gp139 [Rhodococcus phage Trina]ASZ75046.1 hypothetical protein SEA_TRINA_268 [Rhodococcus phage Trina]